IVDGEGRVLHLINADEWSEAFPRLRGDEDYDARTGDVTLFTFDIGFSPKFILLWTPTRRSGWGYQNYDLAEALEKAMAFVKYYWPGFFLDDAQVKDRIDDVKEELLKDHPELAEDEDALKDKALEIAEQDWMSTESGYCSGWDVHTMYSPIDEH